MKVVWEGIPEQFWPDTDRPWRVVSGLGAFADFATEAEAQAYHDELVATLVGDWAESVQAPKNVCERRQVKS